MRGRRAPVTFTVYLTLMVVVLTGVLLVADSAGSKGDPTVGQALFIAMAFTQTALILLLGPVFAAGAIAGERERQTFETLVSTRMTSGGIVLGKVAGALGFLVVLTASSLPLMALAYVFGGVGPSTIFAVYGWDLLLIIWVVSLAVAASSLVGRTLWAAVITYVVVFLAVFMTGFLEVVQMSLRAAAQDGAAQGSVASLVFLYANPFSGLWELAIPGVREELGMEVALRSFAVYGGAWHAVVSAAALGLAVWAVSPLRRRWGRSKG